MRVSTTTPIASLLAAAGEPGKPVTRGRLARLLGLAGQSVRDGEGVKLSTIVRAAEALGLDVEVTVRRRAKTAEKKGAVSE